MISGGESVTVFCVAARSTITRRTFAPPTATTTSRTTVTTTTVSALGVPCLAGIRCVCCFDSSPAERARVQSPSSSRVGLLFVSLTDGCSAKYKTGPAGLVGRKARTPRRIICCRILPRLASPRAPIVPSELRRNRLSESISWSLRKTCDHDWEPKGRRKNHCRLLDVGHVFNVPGTMESCPTCLCLSPYSNESS